ncbi:MAG: autotransporter domain-containing protein [Phascolarctobacterium sp.]|nr:autotransporter domain-containing protein [Phascolarctobacterium sp.]
MKFTTKKSLRRLTAAVSLSLLLATPLAAQAADYDSYIIYSGGKPLFDVRMYHKGTPAYVPDFIYNYRTFSDQEINATISATQFFGDLFNGSTVNSNPHVISVISTTDQNCYAKTNHDDDGKFYAQYALLEGEKYNLSDQTTIRIGYYLTPKVDYAPGSNYYSSIPSVIGTNGLALDLRSAIIHEMTHALGMVAEFKDSGFASVGSKLPLNFEYHLANNEGQFYRDKERYVTSQAVNDWKSWEKDFGIKTADLVYFENNRDKIFYIDVNKPLYFVGDNVAEVLGNYNATPDIPFGQGKLPINSGEFKSVSSLDPTDIAYEIDCSHVELNHSNLSHQRYRNVFIPMEAELAMLQDLGYSLNRRLYFGRSIYESNLTLTNTTGYNDWNSTTNSYISGTYSTTDLGVGLHIYGDNNTVTQAADLLTKGAGAVGVFVTGTNDKVIIPASTNIHADGAYGQGVLINYGKGHTVDVAGTVTALGTGGKALAFDFGDATLGASNIAGSYHSYTITNNNGDANTDPYTGAVTYPENAGTVKSTRNAGITDSGFMNDKDCGYAMISEVNGPLVDNVNITGTVTSGQHAIYMSKNAFVKNINLNAGALLTGDITNEWRHYPNEDILTASGENREPMNLIYNGEGYIYTSFINDLTTNININSDFNFGNNINGADNTRINVNSGTFSFGGVADVVDVTVASGATALGGTYTLNDMTSKAVAGKENDPAFSAATTGKFFNHGTIGAQRPIDAGTPSALTINGNLISDGALQFTAYNDNVGTINVNGDYDTALQTKGSAITIDPNGIYIPEWNYNYIYLNGSPVSLEDEDYALAHTPTTVGLLTSAIEDGTIIFHLADEVQLAPVLANMNEEEAQGYAGAMNVYDANKTSLDAFKELAPILSNNDVKTTMRSVNGKSAARMAAAPQHSNFVERVVGLRTNELSEFDASKHPEGNDLWARYTKTWSDMSGADSHATGFAMGYDKKVSAHTRIGFFAGYERSSLGAEFTSGKAYDRRAGVYMYNTTNKGQGHVYLDVGLQNRSLERSVAKAYTARGDYHSRVYELGGEYKFNLGNKESNKLQVHPYVNTKLSHYSQDAYSEKDAGLLSQNVDGMSSNYWSAGAGIELGKQGANGGYAMRIGYRRALTGSDPALRYKFAGDKGHSYTNNAAYDKDALVLGATAKIKATKNMSLALDAGLERGKNDKLGFTSIEAEWKF